MRRLCILAAIPLALAGCGAKKPPEIDTETIAFNIDRQANRDFPIAVDLVHVLDVAAIERVGALSAAEWFAAREQVQRDFPTGIVVTSYEVVPGQVLPTLALGTPRTTLTLRSSLPATSRPACIVRGSTASSTPWSSSAATASPCVASPELLPAVLGDPPVGHR
jgi:hypothetical protein